MKMVPERSIKIPELGSAASAQHSVMELLNRTFGNESSCQSLFIRLHGGKGEEKVGAPISTDVLLLQLLLVPCKGQNKLQL